MFQKAADCAPERAKNVPGRAEQTHKSQAQPLLPKVPGVPVFQRHIGAHPGRTGPALAFLGHSRPRSAPKRPHRAGAKSGGAVPHPRGRGPRAAGARPQPLEPPVQRLDKGNRPSFATSASACARAKGPLVGRPLHKTCGTPPPPPPKGRRLGAAWPQTAVGSGSQFGGPQRPQFSWDPPLRMARTDAQALLLVPTRPRRGGAQGHPGPRPM